LYDVYALCSYLGEHHAAVAGSNQIQNHVGVGKLRRSSETSVKPLAEHSTDPRQAGSLRYSAFRIRLIRSGSEPSLFLVPQLGILFLCIHYDFSVTLLFLSNNLNLTFLSRPLIYNYFVDSCNTLLYCIFYSN